MNKILNKMVWVVLAAPLIYLAIVWKKLPEKIATHFDIRGNADEYNNKTQFLLIMGIITVIGIGIYLLLTNVYRIDPKKYAAENKDRLKKIAFAVIVFMAAVECIVVYTGERGALMRLDVRFLFALMGLFWAVIGNYMNNIKPNYFAGFRLPWTLESEDNWRHTHHLASKLWFAGGLMITVTCIFLPRNGATLTMFSILFAITIIPIIYSYRFYKKQKSPHSRK